jgi:salicylate hydroxylase
LPVSADKPILINGAGIAGLTTALALGEAGYQCVVYEKAEGFDAIGAGIQLSPNAVGVLSSLGMGPLLSSIASEPLRIDMFNATHGYRIKSLKLNPQIKDRFGSPYFVVHRPNLQSLLFSQCNAHPNVNVQFSSSIIEMAPHQRGVTAMIQSNEQISERLGSSIILADGVWSGLRSSVLKLDPAEYSGKIAWRALIPINASLPEYFKEATTVWLAPKSHIVTYPVRNGDHLNIVAITDGAEQSFGEQLTITAEELKSYFSGMSSDLVKLFDSKARWTGWPVFHHSTPDNLNTGKIALIGDAAHAMLPFAAQGAAMAVEDAAVLARCFKEAETVEVALENYAIARRPRIQKTAKTARANGRIYHLPKPLALCRDFVMAVTPASLLMARQNWIYRWKA